jgi:hypothetical protein
MHCVYVTNTSLNLFPLTLSSSYINSLQQKFLLCESRVVRLQSAYPITRPYLEYIVHPSSLEVVLLRYKLATLKTSTLRSRLSRLHEYSYVQGLYFGYIAYSPPLNIFILIYELATLEISPL